MEQPISNPATARHSICLFAPYFGKIPGDMPLFLKSCRWNPSIRWFIHSDADWSSFSVPDNVTIIPATLPAIAEQAAQAIGCKVSLPRPYKLCDLRPMYGVVFSELARGFDFWGHSDLDMVLGNLRAFLPEESLDTCLRLYENGHLSIYRNNEAGCNAFRLPNNDLSYQEILADPVYQVFDENGINQLFRRHNLPAFRNFQACPTIASGCQDFCTPGEVSHVGPRVFVWRHGKTFREFYENGQFSRKEYAYIHIMRRRMVLAAPDLVDSCHNWLMVPNVFIPAGAQPLSEADMLALNKPSIEYRLRWQVQRLGDYWKRKQYQSAIRREYGYRK